jgi:anti-sigma factor RsiW
MTDRWTDRLSDYVDGELSPAEREEMEKHLFTCAECTAVLEEIRSVIARARALDERPPGHDLWPAIAARIGAGSAAELVELSSGRPSKRLRDRRFAFSLPQLAAACLALIALSGAAAWLARGGLSAPAGTAPSQVALRDSILPDSGTVPPDNGGAGARFASTATSPLKFGEPQYDRAVADLERALREGRGRLDPTTVKVVEHNLRTIDRAIEQARLALAADPGSAYLNAHLAETMRRKLELLRRANEIASART